MKNATFTAGPWRTGAGDFPTIYDRNHDKVAHCLMRPEDENGDGQQTRLANAKLVAAAPDLLTACQAVVAWCDKNPPAGEALHFVQQARDAVAKATGHNAK